MSEELIIGDEGEAERIPHEEEPIELGQWYMVITEDWKGKESEDLMCVCHVGSNFAEVRRTSKSSQGGSSYCRILFDDWDERCVRVYNHQEIIDGKIDECRKGTALIMAKIQEVTARLGVAPRERLMDGEDVCTALATLSNESSVDNYKTDLIKAKDEELPELFDQMKESNLRLSQWMKMELLPHEALAGSLDGVIGKIDDRIFNVELYAGLTEEVVLIRDGEAAPIGEKLRIMQRRCHMDEESLANYEAGGMEYDNLEDFDKWIARDEHFNRLLPFPRCIVTFRVRGGEKDRHNETFSKNPYEDMDIKIWLGDLDKLTFLYIRNGDKLYRMNTDLNFSNKFFPSHVEFDSTKIYVKDKEWSSDKFVMISEDEYEVRCKGYKETRKKFKEWVKSAVDDSLLDELDEGEDPETCGDSRFSRWAYKKLLSKNWRKWYNSDPEISSWSGLGKLMRKFEEAYPDAEWYFKDISEDYFKFDDKSVEYDEINKQISDEIKKYNRMSLIIQGLYDRSPVFHPHPPVQLWNVDSFNQNIELIYDIDYALHPGDYPDFEAYWDRCNENIGVGSVVIGQQRFWEEKEAVRENNRYRGWKGEDTHYTRYRPDGNPGPGFIARVEKITRTGKCTFTWVRECMNWRSYKYGESMPCKLIVHKDVLFNVSAYTPGDFKRFFNDPRWRGRYLEWGPFLLGAEDYHGGKRKIKGEER